MYQYNILQKITRIIIFLVLSYLSLTFIPNASVEQEDKIKLTGILTIIFLVYDIYFPSVHIETKE